MSLTAWNRGSLLRELLEPTGAYPRRRALKKPTASELRDSYPAARTWAAELSAFGDAFNLETVEIGRNTIGSNQVPAAAVFARVDDEIAFAGKTRDSVRVVRLAESLSTIDAALRSWAVRRPLELLKLGDDALTAARVALWLTGNPAPGIFVRQLSMPGVHTKFVEKHRQTIDDMAAVLQAVLRAGIPAAEVPAEESSLPDAGLSPEPASLGEAVLGSFSARTPAARFARRHGFVHPPELVRFRMLDERMPTLGSARDLTMTAEAFSTLRLPVSTVIVTENLVNFLALPDRPDALALFGAGYGFSALRNAAWLQECRVLYWGDLDTHGFRILDQLRAVHPHVSSVLMDEATLHAHREVWGSEPTPSSAELPRLTSEEALIYRALRDHVHGPAVRLEQELIRWDWAIERLT